MSIIADIGDWLKWLLDKIITFFNKLRGKV